MALVENRKKEDPPKPHLLYQLQSGDEDLLRPVIYHNSLPGKNIIKTLVGVLNYWMKVPEDKLSVITLIGDNLHEITIVIDDIQDVSLLRRGRPAAYNIFGVANVANACFFHHLGIYDTISKLNHPKALRMYIDAYIDLFQGQGLELYWRDNSICPSEDEYDMMIIKKAGGIMFLVNNLLQLFSDRPMQLHRLLTDLALYHQIRNDYESLNNELVFDKKGYCEDITEGKFGHPMLHAIQTNPVVGKEIIEILKMRTTDYKQLKHCRGLIEQCGSFKYSLDRLKVIEDRIMEEIEKNGGNPQFKELFARLLVKV